MVVDKNGSYAGTFAEGNRVAVLELRPGAWVSFGHVEYLRAMIRRLVVACTIAIGGCSDDRHLEIRIQFDDSAAKLPAAPPPEPAPR
jgi:hypothetical protein